MTTTNLNHDLDYSIPRWVRSWLNEHVNDNGENPYALEKEGGIYDCMDAVGALIDYAYGDEDEAFEAIVRDEWRKWMDTHR